MTELFNSDVSDHVKERREFCECFCVVIFLIMSSTDWCLCIWRTLTAVLHSSPINKTCVYFTWLPIVLSFLKVMRRWKPTHCTALHSTASLDHQTVLESTRGILSDQTGPDEEPCTLCGFSYFYLHTSKFLQWYPPLHTGNGLTSFLCAVTTV